MVRALSDQHEPERVGAAEPYPKINLSECKGCGRCVVACPKGVLALGERLNERGYRHVVYAGGGCIGCGACYYTCPEPGTFEICGPAGRQGSDGTSGGSPT